ncbi:hypothetical protein R1flu_008765 [Riccia fluitans]|uniref:Uncharacterized protein n=1 Tax=Riccia fluitans TaxID=41844 RepID=A0ABD1XDQ6_9MARC
MPIRSLKEEPRENYEVPRFPPSRARRGQPNPRGTQGFTPSRLLVRMLAFACEECGDQNIYNTGITYDDTRKRKFSMIGKLKNSERHSNVAFMTL